MGFDRPRSTYVIMFLEERVAMLDVLMQTYVGKLLNEVRVEETRDLFLRDIEEVRAGIQTEITGRKLKLEQR
jgi:hypothetical protein